MFLSKLVRWCRLFNIYVPSCILGFEHAESRSPLSDLVLFTTVFGVLCAGPQAGPWRSMSGSTPIPGSRCVYDSPLCVKDSPWQAAVPLVRTCLSRLWLSTRQCSPRSSSQWPRNIHSMIVDADDLGES